MEIVLTIPIYAYLSQYYSHTPVWTSSTKLRTRTHAQTLARSHANTQSRKQAGRLHATERAPHTHTQPQPQLHVFKHTPLEISLEGLKPLMSILVVFARAPVLLLFLLARPKCVMRRNITRLIK